MKLRGVIRSHEKSVTVKWFKSARSLQKSLSRMRLSLMKTRANEPDCRDMITLKLFQI